MTEHDKEPLPPCLIFIDKEGHWYHQGAEMVHREFIRLFYKNMELDSQGRYVILWNGKRCQVEVEDTAFVVWRVQYLDGVGAQGARFILTLSDESEETLAPETLFIGAANVLYCRVKKGAFPARFCRAAYYQIAQYVVEEEGDFFLPLGDRRYPITEASFSSPT